MKTRHLVDPELRAALDQLGGLDAEYTIDRLPALRQMMVDMYASAADFASGVPEIERRDILVPGPEDAPDVRVLVYTHRQLGAGRPAYFYIHGGGFIMGSPEFADTANRMLARELGCVVVAAGYRIAPETVFPGNVEDCYSALKWLHVQAAELAPIPAASPSAERAPAADWQRPWGCWRAIAAKCRSSTSNSFIRCWMIGARPAAIRSPVNSAGRASETVSAGLACLARNPAAQKSRLTLSPARAESLEGLPPTFIGVGSLDLFLEEDTAYALRLIEAGVPVELHVYPGAYHGSDLVTEARVTKAHARDQLAALRAAFAR